MLRRMSEAGSAVASSVKGAADQVVETVTGSPRPDIESGGKKDAERAARLAAAATAQEEDPMAKVAAQAKEAYGWVETIIGPHVATVSAKAKEYGAADVETLDKEGLLTKEAMVTSYNVVTSSAKAGASSKMFILNTVIGDVPFMDKIPKANIAPTDVVDAFIFWNVICLVLGYADVSLFAVVHFGGDAMRDAPMYFPMYVLKLGVDLVVCTFLAYVLYFIMVKSTAARAQQGAMGFLGFVTLKSLAYFYFTPTNVLALAETLANGLCLIRAFLLYKARSSMPYSPLEEEEAVTVTSGPTPSSFPSPPAAPKAAAALAVPPSPSEIAE